MVDILYYYRNLQTIHLGGTLIEKKNENPNEKNAVIVIPIYMSVPE